MPASLSSSDGGQPLLGRGGPGLGQPPHLGVEGAHREAAVHRRPPGGRHQVRQVAQDQGGLGEDAEGVARLAQRLDDPPGQVVLALGVLVGVGVGAHGDVVAGPGPGAQLGPHPLHRVHLDHDPALEVLAGPQAQVVVGGPGEAVGAGVAAAAVGVDGVAEGHSAGLGHPVDHRAGLDVEELHPGVLARAHVAAGGRLVGEEGGGVLLLGRAPAEAGGRAGGHDGQHSEQVFDCDRPAVPRTATPPALALTHCGDGTVVTTKGSASSRSPARTPRARAQGPTAPPGRRGRAGPPGRPRRRPVGDRPGHRGGPARPRPLRRRRRLGGPGRGQPPRLGHRVDPLPAPTAGRRRRRAHHRRPPPARAGAHRGGGRPGPVRPGRAVRAGRGLPDAGGHHRGAAVGRRLPRGPGGPPPRPRAGQRRRGGGARGRGGGGGGALDRGLPGHARTGGGRRRRHGRARRPAVVGRGDHPGGDAARAGRRAALARRPGSSIRRTRARACRPLRRRRRRRRGGGRTGARPPGGRAPGPPRPRPPGRGVGAAAARAPLALQGAAARRAPARPGRRRPGRRPGRPRGGDPPGRPDRRAHRHPLRARAGAGGEGVAGDQPLARHRLRHGLTRRPHPGPHPRPVGHRGGGPQPPAPAGLARRHPRLRGGRNGPPTPSRWRSVATSPAGR